MALKYPPFAAVQEIQDAAKNSPPLKYPMRGIGVTMLQAALIDLKYSMPLTVKKTGFPDGIYGKECVDVVIQFQKDAKLAKKDGIAGKDTILALDERLSKKKPIPSAPTAPKPIMVPKPIQDKDYTFGTANPTIKPDTGAGTFNSLPTEFSMWTLKQAILEILPPKGASAAIFIGFDASKHMLHYLNATGSKLNINLEGMLREVKTAQAHFKNEVKQAQLFSEKLAVGTHKITSITAESAYNYKEESKNWFFAVGGYSTWGKGTVVVTKSVSGKMNYAMDFEFHFYDRYNWDAGKSVTIGPITITDQFMGEFHRQGLAQEYDEVAVISRKFQWEQGSTIPESQYQKGNGR